MLDFDGCGFAGVIVGEHECGVCGGGDRGVCVAVAVDADEVGLLQGDGEVGDVLLDDEGLCEKRGCFIRAGLKRILEQTIRLVIAELEAAGVVCGDRGVDAQGEVLGHEEVAQETAVDLGIGAAEEDFKDADVRRVWCDGGRVVPADAASRGGLDLGQPGAVAGEVVVGAAEADVASLDKVVEPMDIGAGAVGRLLIDGSGAAFP